MQFTTLAAILVVLCGLLAFTAAHPAAMLSGGAAAAVFRQPAEVNYKAPYGAPAAAEPYGQPAEEPANHYGAPVAAEPYGQPAEEPATKTGDIPAAEHDFSNVLSRQRRGICVHYDDCDCYICY